MSEIFQRLAKPFADHEHEWLTQIARGDRKLVVPYIRKPSIIKRLTEVVGFGNYNISVEKVSEDKEAGDDDRVKYTAVYRSVLTLDVDGKTVEFSDIGVGVSAKRDTAEKGGATDAIKRAAKLAGIGLYLDNGSLHIWIDRESQDPRVSFFGGKTVTLHPSLTVPLGKNKGKSLEMLDDESLEGLYNWFNEEERYKEDEYFWRLRETIRLFMEVEG